MFVDSISFDYQYYQENILLIGMIGSGKSQLTRKILDGIPNARRWIWDESSNFHEYGEVITDLSKLNAGNYCIDLAEKSTENFEIYTEYLYQNALNYKLMNHVNVVDEVQKYTNPHDTNSFLKNIVTSMRNRAISNIFITPSPSLIPSWIKNNTLHVFALRTVDYGQLEYMERNFFGKEAWLLTSSDKRKKMEDEINLEPYSFIYRDMRKSETEVYNNLSNSDSIVNKKY